MQQKYCAAQSSADRISLFPVRLPRTRLPSAFGRSRVLCRLARALAEFPRLRGQHLHLALDIIGLQSHHVLDVSRPHQLLGKFERARDVSFGESHRLFSHILGTLAGALGLPFECAHGLVRRRNKTVESLPRLLDTLFLSANARISGGTSKRSVAAIVISSCGSAWIATPSRRATC